MANEVERALWLDDDDDDGRAPPESRMMDPLAAEPLTSAEMTLIEAVPNDMDEDHELIMHALSCTTECDMPQADETNDAIPTSTDQMLHVWRRPKERQP